MRMLLTLLSSSYLSRYYFIVCLSNNRIFFEDIMNKLRRNDNFYVSAFYSFRPRVDDLTRPAPFLAFLRSFCEKKMLRDASA